jgi:hypothetical protein
MRPNRYIILLSLLLGAFGTWFSIDAVGQYLNTTRSLGAMEVRYVEGSFVWLDPDYERARASFEIVNASRNDVTIPHYGQQLRFDNAFAGARYHDWEILRIPAGESQTFEVVFFIPVADIRRQGGEAELTVEGQLRLDFEGIERDMTVRTWTRIGQVAYEESGS